MSDDNDEEFVVSTTPDYGMPAELKTAIGEVIVEFQGLENTLQDVVSMVMPCAPAISWMVTAHLSFKNLCALLPALYRHQYPDDDLVDELEEILGQATSCEQQRNTIVHSFWGYGQSTKRTARRELKFSQQIHVDDSQIRAISRKCSEVNTRVVAFTFKLAEKHGVAWDGNDEEPQAQYLLGQV